MQAAQIDTRDFATELRRDIAANRIRLPTLPDVALSVKQAAEDASSSEEIAAILAKDIALSGRMVQLANSPLYRGVTEVDSIQGAVTRLGTKLVKHFVISLAVRQLFDSSSSVLSCFFRDAWEDGVEVAAISRVLAADVPGIDPEEAMLGGLLHNIGALPILARLDETCEGDMDVACVKSLVDELAPEVGTRILESWQLADALTAVPEGCHVLARDSGPAIDHADIVLAARLQYLFSTGMIELTEELCHLPAPAKLGIHIEVIELEQDATAAWTSQIREALNC